MAYPTPQPVPHTSSTGKAAHASTHPHSPTGLDGAGAHICHAELGSTTPDESESHPGKKGTGMPSLQCAIRKYGDLIAVVTTGDVDLASSEVLWSELHAQLVPASALGLECSGITFMDSMGLQVLMRAHQHAAEQQASFALIGANQYVDRVLELTGLTDVIPHFPDAESARSQLCSAAD